MAQTTRLRVTSFGPVVVDDGSGVGARDVSVSSPTAAAAAATVFVSRLALSGCCH